MAKDKRRNSLAKHEKRFRSEVSWRHHKRKKNRKTGNRNQEQAFVANRITDPTGRQQNDRTDHNIGRHHPANLVLRGRECSLHMRQGDSSDCPINRIDHAGQNCGRRNQTAIFHRLVDGRLSSAEEPFL